MRSRQEILGEIISNINKAPKETRCMLIHEKCFVEVMVDIRDVLTNLSLSIESALVYLDKQS